MNLFALILAGIACGGWLVLLGLYSRLQRDCGRLRIDVEQLERQVSIVNREERSDIDWRLQLAQQIAHINRSLSQRIDKLESSLEEADTVALLRELRKALERSAAAEDGDR